MVDTRVERKVELSEKLMVGLMVDSRGDKLGKVLVQWLELE